MNEAQQLFGEPSERARSKIRDHMVPWIQDFIRNVSFLVMASSNAQGHCDASPRGGLSGFVRVVDEKRLLIPDVAGNKLFQSYENFESNPHVGLIFFIPSVNATVRVNGTVQVVRRGEEAFDSLTLRVFEPDEKARLYRAILVEVMESYSQCPRALMFSKLWNRDIIAQNETHPPVSPWVPGV